MESQRRCNRRSLVPAAITARELGIQIIETVRITSYHKHGDQRQIDIIKGISDDLIVKGGTAKKVRNNAVALLFNSLIQQN